MSGISTRYGYRAGIACSNDLHAAGIGAGIHYPVPVHLTPAFAGLGTPRGRSPSPSAPRDELLSLPLFPEITAEQQQRVATVLMSAL